MNHLLDNIVWHSLTGPQACFASGSDGARRYTRGFSPIVGFADNVKPDFSALNPWCHSDEHFYTDGWAGTPPADWQIEQEATMFKMVWDSSIPPADDLHEAIPLEKQHAAQALELADLTRPGPFGIRTIELGEYFGCFEGERLMAMAGERMFAGSWREISGVCTHPDYQGAGLARRLMIKLIHRELQRGELPFLHVMHDNDVAVGLYKRMGFSIYKESIVRVISRC